ncbi:MAG: hypothetical protein GEV11_13285 [Streptosporangiales bacterium]|nr:hypothetical protein [Streptosporangiales bacterium]
MIDPENLEASIRCVNFSTFREMPSSGIERIKYSLESARSAEGLSYILDVEIDRRVGSDRAERLVGVRLVMRRAQGGPSGDLMPSAMHIIGSCIQSLIFPGATEGEIRAFFRTRFGWDWPPTQSGPIPSPSGSTARTPG